MKRRLRNIAGAAAARTPSTRPRPDVATNAQH
jgi:hypothetical protein